MKNIRDVSPSGRFTALGWGGVSRALALGAVVFAAGLSAPPAYAVHATTVFELDGNATSNSASPNAIDFDYIYNNQGNGKSFTSDPFDSASDKIYFQGGSKDGCDINTSSNVKCDKGGVKAWLNTSGKPTPKDDLEHAYAYSAKQGTDDVIYFGADRWSNNGDSAIGFWFFKGPVEEKADGTFSGTHTAGDILITADFLQGGSEDVINVFVWDPSAPSNPKLIASSTTSGGTSDANGVFCLAGQYDDAACAGVNRGTPNAPWPYEFQGSPSAVFPQGTFFEGGINLTKLNLTACFSNYLAMTRSSASTSAQLKDYILGPFKTCSISVTKQCSVDSVATSGNYYLNVSYNGVVTNTGGASLPAGTVITESDTATNSSNSDVPVVTTQTLQNPLPPGGTVTFSGTYTTYDNPPRNTVTATAVFGSNTLTSTFSVDCTGRAFPNALTVEKACGIPASGSTAAVPAVQLVTEGGALKVKVNTSGVVCNTGTTDLATTVYDDEVGNILSPVKVFDAVIPHPAAGAPPVCAPWSHSYLPNAADGSTSPASDAMFSDTATASGHSSVPGATQPQDVTATKHCPLCPPCTGTGCSN